MTRVCLTPSWLVGIFSLRGEIVPAIDLGPWLGMSRASVSDASRLVVLRHTAGGSSLVLGLLVDQLDELRVLDPAELSPPPPSLTRAQLDLVRGVHTSERTTLRVLDPAAIFAADALKSLSRRVDPTAVPQVNPNS
jgi:purine-binding chemotaxis protein CheW